MKIKTWCVRILSLSVFIEAKCVGMKGSMKNVIWIPKLEKQLARKGLSHRAKNHHQHRVVLIDNVSLEVQSEIWTHMVSDRQTLLVIAHTDGKRPCLGNGKTVPKIDLIRPIRVGHTDFFHVDIKTH